MAGTNTTNTTKRLPWYWLAGLVLLGLSAIFVPYVILPALVAGFVLSVPWIIASIAGVLASIAGLRIVYSAWTTAPKQQDNITASVFKDLPTSAHQRTSKFLSDAETYNFALLNKHLDLNLKKPLEERKLIKLIQVIMKGNPGTVKAIIRSQPDLLFQKWQQAMTDPSGRTFEPTTAFKLILWLMEPMRDEVLACIPKNRADLHAQIDQQKKEFSKEGLNYTFQDKAGGIQTVSKSKGYSLAPIITLVTNMRAPGLNMVKFHELIPIYGEQLREVPYWIAQLLCNDDGPFSDLKTFNKEHFRAPVNLNGSDEANNWFGSNSKLNSMMLYWAPVCGVEAAPYPRTSREMNSEFAGFTGLETFMINDAKAFMSPSVETKETDQQGISLG